MPPSDVSFFLKKWSASLVLPVRDYFGSYHLTYRLALTLNRFFCSSDLCYKLGWPK